MDPKGLENVDVRQLIISAPLVKYTPVKHTKDTPTKRKLPARKAKTTPQAPKRTRKEATPTPSGSSRSSTCGSERGDPDDGDDDSEEEDDEDEPMQGPDPLSRQSDRICGKLDAILEAIQDLTRAVKENNKKEEATTNLMTTTHVRINSMQNILTAQTVNSSPLIPTLSGAPAAHQPVAHSSRGQPAEARQSAVRMVFSDSE